MKTFSYSSKTGKFLTSKHKRFHLTSTLRELISSFPYSKSNICLWKIVKTLLLIRPTHGIPPFHDKELGSIIILPFKVIFIPDFHQLYINVLHLSCVCSFRSYMIMVVGFLLCWVDVFCLFPNTPTFSIP